MTIHEFGAENKNVIALRHPSLVMEVNEESG